MQYNFKHISVEHMRNYVLNVIKRRFSTSRCFRPLLTTLYVTLKCNLNCNYCNQIQCEHDELDTKGMCRLLEKIRPHNPALNITGGEPLNRPDIVEILKKARSLRFSPIALNTNALLLHKKEVVLNHVDYLIISLDSLDMKKWDNVLGKRGASKVIINNIKRYKLQERKYRYVLTVNSVVTPDTISDIQRVIEFCQSLDVPMGVVPQENGTTVIPGLVNNREYNLLMKKIIKMKKNGYKGCGSNVYLRQISEFTPHNCFPTLVPRIYPDGSVFYPCEPLNKVYGNLMEYQDLYTMIKEAYQKEGLPDCTKNSTKCFMSCYMEFVNGIERPWEIF